MTPMDQQSTALLYGFCSSTSGAAANKNQRKVSNSISTSCITVMILANIISNSTRPVLHAAARTYHLDNMQTASRTVRIMKGSMHFLFQDSFFNQLLLLLNLYHAV